MDWRSYYRVGEMGLSENKRLLLEKFVGGKCEICQKKSRLIAHRIKRGWDGGRYEHRNIKMLCNECHKKIHWNEF
ncbi:MAG: hypothetical protein IH948_00145 [Bacteroidetes bacterium]|nr:hypothetical protein [Bacteroidota bacterium]